MHVRYLYAGTDAFVKRQGRTCGSSEVPIPALDMRLRPRHKIFQVGEMRVGDRVTKVHLLDISEDGARLHCPVVTGVGTAIVLNWRDQRWRAVIVWQMGEKCGVRFIFPLSPTTVALLIAPL